MSINISNKVQSVDFGNILQPVSNMTVMCWFYNTDNSTYQMLFGREDNGNGNPGWHLEINASAKGGFHGDHGPNMVFTNTTIQLNTWYHMVGVRDSASGNQRIYLNGVLENTTANLLSLETVVNEMQVGETLGWPGEGFIGQLDDLRFYNRVLNDDEIQTIYACKGCDSIADGLQFRQTYSEGSEGQPIGSFATPIIDNIRNQSSSSSGSSLTLTSYNATNENNLVLIVVTSAESSSSSRVQASSLTYNNNNLTKLASVRTTTGYIGVDIWSKSILPNETGNIVATWSGSNSRRTILAYSIKDISSTPDNTVTAYNNSGNISTNITTINKNSMIVSAGVNESGYNLTAVGTDHIIDLSLVVGSTYATAIGHIFVENPNTLSGIGFNASSTSGMVMALAVFPPLIIPEQVTELSNNEYIGIAKNVPTYENTFLKLRRY